MRCEVDDAGKAVDFGIDGLLDHQLGKKLLSFLDLKEQREKEMNKSIVDMWYFALKYTDVHVQFGWKEQTIQKIKQALFILRFVTSQHLVLDIF